MLQIELSGKVKPAEVDEFIKPAAPPAKPPLQFAIDPSGHRWVINRTERCIDVYQGRTRIKQIGMGILFDPTAIVVDHNAYLYIIDRHKLIKLEPLPTQEEWEQNHKDVLPQPNDESGTPGP
jgi:hypothetical protein